MISEIGISILHELHYLGPWSIFDAYVLFTRHYYSFFSLLFLFGACLTTLLSYSLSLPLFLPVFFSFILLYLVCMHKLILFMADRERIVERTSVYINRFHTSTSRSGNSRIFLSIFLFINVIIIYIFFLFFIEGHISRSSSNEYNLYVGWLFVELNVVKHFLRRCHAYGDR